MKSLAESSKGLKISRSFLNRISAEAVNSTRLIRGPGYAADPLYKNAFYLMLSTAATSLLGFFFWIVAARTYPESEVGLGSAIISAISLITVLSLAGLNNSIIRFLPQNDRPEGLINSCFTVSGLITLAATAIFIIFINTFSPVLSFVRQNAIFSFSFLAIAILSTWSNIIDSSFIARRKAGLVFSKNIILSLLKLPALVIFVLFFHTFGIIASWGIGLGIAFFISVFLFLPRVEKNYRPVPVFKLSRIKGIISYSGGSYIASLLAQSSTLILPILVVNILGTRDNAYFYIAWTVSRIVSSISGSVSQSLFAEGSNQEKNTRKDVARSLKFTFLLLVPITIVVIASAKWILLAFGQGYSSNSLILLWLLCASSLPQAIIDVYTSILRVQDRLKELVIIRFFTSTAILALSFLVMPASGIVGIGYVWLGIQGLVSIALVFRLRSWAKRPEIISVETG